MKVGNGKSELEQLQFLLRSVLKTSVADTVTIRIFCNEYTAFIKENRTWSYYKSITTSFGHLKDYFGAQRLLQSIELRDTEKFISYLQKKAKKGYRVYYRTLKAAFNKAVEWNYINKNYFVNIRLPKRQRMAPVFIRENEFKRILEFIKNDNVKDVVKFAYCTGMRLGEIVNLKWRNVNFEDNYIAVGDEEFITKGKSQRFVPINKEVLNILNKYFISQRKTKHKNIFRINGITTTEGNIFSNRNGNGFTGDYYSKKFKEGCREAGMNEAYHFHTLRHSFASNLVQSGVSLYVVKELLGHSTISTTEIYSHLDIESLREAVCRLE